MACGGEGASCRNRSEGLVGGFGRALLAATKEQPARSSARRERDSNSCRKTNVLRLIQILSRASSQSSRTLCKINEGRGFDRIGAGRALLSLVLERLPPLPSDHISLSPSYFDPPTPVAMARRSTAADSSVALDHFDMLISSLRQGSLLEHTPPIANPALPPPPSETGNPQQREANVLLILLPLLIVLSTLLFLILVFLVFVLVLKRKSRIRCVSPSLLPPPGHRVYTLRNPPCPFSPLRTQD